MMHNNAVSGEEVAFIKNLADYVAMLLKPEMVKSSINGEEVNLELVAGMQFNLQTIIDCERDENTKNTYQIIKQELLSKKQLDYHQQKLLLEETVDISKIVNHVIDQILSDLILHSKRSGQDQVSKMHVVNALRDLIASPQQPIINDSLSGSYIPYLEKFRDSIQEYRIGEAPPDAIIRLGIPGNLPPSDKNQLYVGVIIASLRALEESLRTSPLLDFKKTELRETIVHDITRYGANSDGMRQRRLGELEDVEQLLENQRLLIATLRRGVDIRDESIAFRDESIALRDESIALRDQIIADRDQALDIMRCPESGPLTSNKRLEAVASMFRGSSVGSARQLQKTSWNEIYSSNKSFFIKYFLFSQKFVNNINAFVYYSTLVAGVILLIAAPELLIPMLNISGCISIFSEGILKPIGLTSVLMLDIAIKGVNIASRYIGFGGEQENHQYDKILEKEEFLLIHEVALFPAKSIIIYSGFFIVSLALSNPLYLAPILIDPFINRSLAVGIYPVINIVLGNTYGAMECLGLVITEVIYRAVDCTNFFAQKLKEVFYGNPASAPQQPPAPLVQAEMPPLGPEQAIGALGFFQEQELARAEGEQVIDGIGA